MVRNFGVQTAPEPPSYKKGTKQLIGGCCELECAGLVDVRLLSNDMKWSDATMAANPAVGDRVNVSILGDEIGRGTGAAHGAHPHFAVVP